MVFARFLYHKLVAALSLGCKYWQTCYKLGSDGLEVVWVVHLNNDIWSNHNARSPY